VRYRRTLERLRDRIPDPAYWRALNPDLTITDEPLSRGLVPFDLPPMDAEAIRDCLRIDGYVVLPPVVPPAEIARLRRAIERVVDAGFPPGFVLVYDDFYQLYLRLSRVFDPLLGPKPLLLPKESWAFFVPAGDGARSRWTAFNEHRDYLGPDPAVLASEPPTLLTCWVPLSDVTTLDSCLYVVPGDCDPDYHTDTKAVDPARIRLQDIRALPAAAGSLVIMTSHLIHWGSRSSPLAQGPRVSMTLCLQRRDMPPYDRWAIDADVPAPFRSRLTWVYDSMPTRDAGALEALLPS
jgi:hypothetical protein